MKAPNKDVTIVRNMIIRVYPTPHNSTPNFEFHAPDLATTAELLLLGGVLVVGGLVLAGGIPAALMEVVEPVVDAMRDVADALSAPVIPTHSVAR